LSLTLKEAHEIETLLSRVFREVHVNGTEQKPAVIARDHFIIPLSPGCPHKVKLLAKNITAIITGGYLTSGPVGKEVRYGTVEFCQRCEAVFATTAYVR